MHDEEEADRGPEVVRPSEVERPRKFRLKPKRQRGQRHPRLAGEDEFKQKLFQSFELQRKDHHSQTTDSFKSKTI